MKQLRNGKVINEAAKALGSLGGKASASRLTAKQRTERAKKAVTAREIKRMIKPL